MKIKIFAFLIFFLTLFYFLINNFIIQEKRFSEIKKIIPQDTKIFIKKYFFPYKYITELEKIKKQNQDLQKNVNQFINQIKPYELDLIKKNRLDPLVYKKTKTKKLNYKNLKISIYENTSPFLSGILRKIPGSAYLDYYENKIFIASSIGIIGYAEINEKEIKFKQIKNNINEYLNERQFKKGGWFTIKDLFINKNKIYLSYTRELKENCWNTSLLSSDLDLNKLEFKILYSPKKCIKSLPNKEGEFNAHQSGGRIISTDESNLIFSIGDYRQRYLPQDNENDFGKILNLNINTGNSKILSLGHRNPQGLYFDSKENFILETEHGPEGGDEINIIIPNKNPIPNFGWPIASYGEHYGGKNEKNLNLYKKYPLLKSHKDNGFIEPIKYFTPSIGISQITKIEKINEYLLTSLIAESLYFFELDSKELIINDLTKIFLGERIRDIIYTDNMAILFLENTGSIGIIKF